MTIPANWIHFSVLIASLSENNKNLQRITEHLYSADARDAHAYKPAAATMTVSISAPKLFYHLRPRLVEEICSVLASIIPGVLGGGDVFGRVFKRQI
jgi:hypothetical protein